MKAPRIEFWYRPTEIETPELGNPEARNIKGPQRWHVVYVAGNGEPLASSETFGGPTACASNVWSMALLFSHRVPEEAYVVIDGNARPWDDEGDGKEIGHLHIQVDDETNETIVDVPIFYRTVE
jgi:hypothetical protein